MNELLRALGTSVYAACVDFMLNLASILGATYRDANALVLIVGFPVTTFLLLVVCAAQRVALRRARLRQRRWRQNL